MRKYLACGILFIGLLFAETAGAEQAAVQLGPRPAFLIDQLADGLLKSELQSCAAGPFTPREFSIGHRGAPLQFPEHTRESYLAAARMGAGILECDVTFTADRELVCRHSQCDLHTTTDILTIPDLAAKCSEPFTPADKAAGRKASAKCCASDITLADFQRLKGKMDAADPWAITVEDYVAGGVSWRTDLYSEPGSLMTLDDSIALFDSFDVKHVPELKTPEVDMPFDGDFTAENYADAMVDAYRKAGIAPVDVYLQSFDLDVIRYWLANEPVYGKQAVFLDGRYSREGFDPNDPETWSPDMAALHAEGLHFIAPPIWMLLTLDEAGKIRPSTYAKAAREAGLEIITWTLERSGPLGEGGGWYYQSVADAIENDGDALVVLDVLAREVGVRGVFSDWPATTTYYANCVGLN